MKTCQEKNIKELNFSAPLSMNKIEGYEGEDWQRDFRCNAFTNS
jgi:hypothetical protein